MFDEINAGPGGSASRFPRSLPQTGRGGQGNDGVLDPPGFSGVV